MNNQYCGSLGEKMAEKYLIKNGYKILAKNCKFVGAELDIVAMLTKKTQVKKIKADYKKGKYKSKEAVKYMIDSLQDKIIFVEVKFSSTRVYGEPYERVDKNKQRQILKASQMFMFKNKLDNEIRYDVISIVGKDIEHIENAF